MVRLVTLFDLFFRARFHVTHTHIVRTPRLVVWYYQNKERHRQSVYDHVHADSLSYKQCQSNIQATLG